MCHYVESAAMKLDLPHPPLRYDRTGAYRGRFPNGAYYDVWLERTDPEDGERYLRSVEEYDTIRRELVAMLKQWLRYVDQCGVDTPADEQRSGNMPEILEAECGGSGNVTLKGNGVDVGEEANKTGETPASACNPSPSVSDAPSQQEGKAARKARPERRKKSGPSHRSEAEIRTAIEKALNDQHCGDVVVTRKERIVKAEVAKRCSLSADYIKESREWRFYAANGYVRPFDEPTEAERTDATELLEELLPEHRHVLQRMEGMGSSDRLEYVGELTRMLIPITKLPRDERIENGHMAIQQLSDDKAKAVHPRVTPPGENTPAVPRFEVTPTEKS